MNCLRLKQTQKEISFTGVTILLAEDNDLNAEIATQGARFIGLKTESKHWNCFAIVRKGTFQVIWDIMMPEMNGLRPASSIRALKQSDAERIPIIAIFAIPLKKM